MPRSGGLERGSKTGGFNAEEKDLSGTHRREDTGRQKAALIPATRVRLLITIAIAMLLFLLGELFRTSNLCND